MTFLRRVWRWLDTVPGSLVTPPLSFLLVYQDSFMQVHLLPIIPATPTGGSWSITHSLDGGAETTEPLHAGLVIPAESDQTFTRSTRYTDADGLAWPPSPKESFRVPGRSPSVAFTVAEPAPAAA